MWYFMLIFSPLMFQIAQTMASSNVNVQIVVLFYLMCVMVATTVVTGQTKRTAVSDL